MVEIRNCDCLEFLRSLDDDSVDCVVTSPPYNKSWFSKQSPSNQVWCGFDIKYHTYSDDMPLEEYEAWMVDVLDECVKKIKPDGSIFFNHKPVRHDNEIYHPLQFILKSSAKIYQEIIWNRKNSPNIRKDILVPCTERVYWLCKGKPRTYRDALAGAYVGEVWDIFAKPMKEHPAPFPETLVENCVRLSTVEGDLVVDPFSGSGTTALVSRKLKRNFIGGEICAEYCDLAKSRVSDFESTDLFGFFDI